MPPAPQLPLQSTIPNRLVDFTKMSISSGHADSRPGGKLNERRSSDLAQPHLSLIGYQVPSEVSSEVSHVQAM